MKTLKTVLFVLIVVLTVGCVRNIESVRNGRTVSSSRAVSGPGFASLRTSENDQPYDECLARAGSMPNRGLVTATCMDNAMRALVREQCGPQIYGLYTPRFWGQSPTFLECLNQVGWMPNGQDEAICLKQVMISNSTNVCAMLAPTGMSYGYGPVTVIN